MKQIKTIELTPDQIKELEKGFKRGSSHCFRIRCLSILLRSEGRNPKDIAAITRVTEVSVYNWLKRYEQEGIQGLFTRPGRGRRASSEKKG
jgi:putative transposase